MAVAETSRSGGKSSGRGTTRVARTKGAGCHRCTDNQTSNRPFALASQAQIATHSIAFNTVHATSGDLTNKGTLYSAGHADIAASGNLYNAAVIDTGSLHLDVGGSV